MSASLLLHDAVLIDSDGRREGWVLVDGGVITEVGSGAGRPDGVGTDGVDTGAADTGARVIDLDGRVLSPGFIDLHGHGAAGVAYDDDADLSAALEHHRRHGTTRQVLSLVSAPVDAQERSLRRIAELAARDPLVLGAHLEGPYLSPERKGAHDERVLVAPTRATVERQLAAADGRLRMVTIAPEIDGAEEAQRLFQEAGVVVAVGHTAADYALALEAFERGAGVLTHAFNAMAPLLHRAPGPVMAAVDAGVVVELILDGVHVHPAMSRGLFRLAPGRVALVTDAMSATGCADGDYELGGLDVVVEEGAARLAGTDTLAGSVLTQDVALRTAVTVAGVDPVAAITALTRTPADLLGRADLGSVRRGARADLVVLDAEWAPRFVLAEGIVLLDEL